MTLDLLGLMEQELGEFEDAGRRHDRASQIRRAVFDPRPSPGQLYANIAQLRMRTGRFAEAEELIMRALEIRTTTLRGDYRDLRRPRQSSPNYGSLTSNTY